MEPKYPLHTFFKKAEKGKMKNAQKEDEGKRRGRRETTE